MITQPGKGITWGEVHVGTRHVFADAGLTEAATQPFRRVVMRIGFRQGGDAR